MNLVDLLGYAFDGAPGNPQIFSTSTEDVVVIEDFNSAKELISNLDRPVIDLITDAGYVVAVTSEKLADDKASFRMIHEDGRVLNVFMLDVPVGENEIDGYGLEIPIPGKEWRIEFVTDCFYTVAELETDNADSHSDDDALEASSPSNSNDAESAGVDSEGAEKEGVAHEKAGLEGEIDVGARSAPTPYLAGALAKGLPVVNDCVVFGEENAEFDAILERDVTVMLGEMYGANNRNNTQDGKWKPFTVPLSGLFVGFPETEDKPAFGLSRHPEAKKKEGASIVLSATISGARNAKSVKTVYFLGLDIDSGDDFDSVQKTILDHGYAAFMYTTHSHGATTLQLKRDEVLKKLNLKTDPTVSQIREYLRDHDSHRYSETFLNSIEIEDGRHQLKTGTVIILKTAPQEKFRVFFPLKNPIDLLSIAPTDIECLKKFENKVTGFAWGELKIPFDPACTDPSRLFFVPKHKPGDTGWKMAVIQGRPVDFDKIRATDKALYNKKVDANPYAAAGNGGSGASQKQYLTPSGKSLNRLHSEVLKSRFEVADFLEEVCPDKIASVSGSKSSIVHIECPFAGEHSSDELGATMVVNATESTSDYYVIKCLRGSCKERHKLEFLEKMLADGWFTEEELLTSDHIYPTDGPEEEELPTKEAAFEGTAQKTFIQRAMEFDKTTHSDVIHAFAEEVFNAGVDLVETNHIREALAEYTALTKTQINRIWKKMNVEQAKLEAKAVQEDATTSNAHPMIETWGHGALLTYGKKMITKRNAENPILFHHFQDTVAISEDDGGSPVIKALNLAEFTARVDPFLNYCKSGGAEADPIHTHPPKEVMSILYNGEMLKYPPLRGVVTTPIFGKDGNLLTDYGYDVRSGLYYWPDHRLSIPRVPLKPTDEEVYEAKRVLIEEVFADFPIGGCTRQEIMDRGLNGEGIAALTNLIGMTLLPFVREMIDGPTPAHLITKPQAGTGASLLSDMFAIIATGSTTPAMTIPSSREEMQKTLTAVLSNGQPVVLFDNITHEVDSGELASALTAKEYAARVLGTSRTVKAEVRCVWVLTGNNITLSSELLRRLVMVKLNAKASDPTARSNWRHDNIRQYVLDNRGALVHACLTIIQSWVAAGMPTCQEANLPSYENWSRIVGSILKHADLGGFMANRDELYADAGTEADDGTPAFVSAWWENFNTTAIPVKSPTQNDMEGLIGLVMKCDLSLPVRRARDNDGEFTLDSQAFGRYLRSINGRVFDLEHCSVTVSGDKRNKKGTLWALKLVENPTKKVK